MEKKLFRFKTGVKVFIDSNQISASDNSGTDKMDTANLDSFQYEEYYTSRLSPAALDLIPFFVGTFFLLLGSFVHPVFDIVGYILLVIAAISFVFTMLDAVLHTGLARRIIARYLSHKGYAVTIGNKSGNNLLFYTQLDELDKIKLLDSALDEFKAYLNSKNGADTPHQSTTSTNSLDELKKLGELLASGVLTQEEFDKKKKELLII